MCEGLSMIIEQDEDEFMALVVVVEDPKTFEEAAKFEKWRKAMEAEMKSINDNNTWELVDVPESVKVIGVKWVYKTKLNEKGEVDKFKARLVVKGFHQTYRVDFYEVFAPVARWDTIRLILGLAAQEDWVVLQLNLKSTFLHGELSEDVFVEQPKRFEVAGGSEKVYRLKKALYGLRHAPRAWYSRMERYFARDGLKKCYCEHTLFIKAGKEGILVLSLYVDDLIYTSNSTTMLEDFRSAMEKKLP